MKLTLRKLAHQMQAQGSLILSLTARVESLARESALRSQLEIANRRSSIMSEEARADLPEVSRNKDFGHSVRDKTPEEVLDERFAAHMRGVTDYIDRRFNDIEYALREEGPTPAPERADLYGDEHYCSHCGRPR